MKIRCGFVSNSSSSSFVIIGVKQNGSYEDMEKQEFPNRIQTIYTECHDYDYITGIMLARGSSDNGDYLNDYEISLPELNEKALKVAEALKIDITKVELIMGTYPS